MAIQIGAKPDSGFDDPIGMLKDCHRRIQGFLAVLCTVAERAQGRSMTMEESDAVQNALRYFRTGGQRHTADEEQSLFPRLRAAAADSLPEIDGLEHDHSEATEMHASVERLFDAWLASGGLRSDEAQELSSATDRLKKLYIDHIEIEETAVFTRALEVLDSSTLAAIGREFSARRQG